MEAVGMWSLRRIKFVAFWVSAVDVSESQLYKFMGLHPPTYPLPTQGQISFAACGSLEVEWKGLVEVRRRRSMHAVTKSNVHSVMGQL